jgi:GntR family transcriptional regulator of arabinose operon
VSDVSEYKYLTIVDWVKKQIDERGLAAGEKFYSESELCEIHKMSRQTVRQALAVLERQNILWKRRGSGTFVQTPGRGKAKQILTVGVIATYFSDYIFPSIVTGIERELNKNSAAMQLATTHNRVADETRSIQAMLAQNVDGLIVEPSKSALPNPNMALYDEIRSRGIPLLFFNARYPWSDLPLVAMDDVEAGRLAANHLITLGHEKISAVFVFDDRQGHLRYQGFMECLNTHGILNAEQRVLWLSTQDREVLFTVLKERVLALLSDSTAVVCYNDNLAVAMLDFCKKQGIRVPDDVSLVGIDDSDLAAICEAPLTTVAHPKQELGRKAAAMLLEMIKSGGNNIGDCLYKPKLVLRESSKKPKAP